MVRSAAVAVAVVVCVGALSAEVDFEPYREAMAALLADEATPEITLPAKLGPQGLPSDPAWPDLEGFALSPQNRAIAGWGVVDPKASTLVGFTLTVPDSPIPSDTLSPEDAIPIAEGFCRRHFPELSAEGGEVAVTVEDEISPIGARIVRLQRTVKGVNVPTLAEVGVRVFDGKVVHYRHRHTPLDDALQLPGDVTEERAREIAASNIKGNTQAIAMWLPSTREVILTPSGQRNVWTIWAETKTKNAPDSTEIAFFGRWAVDANTEEIVIHDLVDPTREQVWWYWSHGGKRWPRRISPWRDPLFKDESAWFSPDCKRLLVCSNRPREGYPAWQLKRPGSLFIVDLETGKAECLGTGPTAYAAWSPDGAEVSFVAGPALQIMDLTTGAVTRFEPEKTWGYGEHLWLPDGRIAAMAIRYAQEYRAVLLDPAQPDAPAVIFPKPPAEARWGNLALAPDGRLLAKADWHVMQSPPSDPKRRSEPICVCALDPAEPQAAPVMLVEFLPDIGNWMPAPEGRLLCPRRGPGGPFLLNPATGEMTPWELPQISFPMSRNSPNLHPERNLRFSPDGTAMAFPHAYWPADRDQRPADLIFLCAPDGTNVRLGTKPDQGPAEMWVSP